MRSIRVRMLAVIAAILILSGLGVWVLVHGVGIAEDPIANVVDNGSLTARQANYMCEPGPNERAIAIRECTMPVPCVTPETVVSSRNGRSASKIEKSQCSQPSNSCLTHVRADIIRIGALPADTAIAVLQRADDQGSWRITTVRPSDNAVRSYVYEPCGDGGRGHLRADVGGQKPDTASRP